MQRGVLYVVWGDKSDPVLERSIASVKEWHPELPIHIHREEEGGLRTKARMAHNTPFESTLYLDADTVVMGRLDHAFGLSERVGLACCICEAPWMRRYGHDLEDLIEYNTGVLFFTQKSRVVFDLWDSMANLPSKSRWALIDKTPRGLEFDDQAGFGRSVAESGLNPAVLPVNYNLRGDWFHRSFFAPVKIWHGYSNPPEYLSTINKEIYAGLRPVTYIRM